MLEIQTIFIWLVVGTWICYKRDWYRDTHIDTPNFICTVSIIFAPIALLIAFFDVFIKNSWKKDVK